MPDSLPFNNLRVIDLGCDISTSYAGKMLADAGAEVVKLEPTRGDPMRRWKASVALDGGAPLPAGETGALYHFLNGNKIHLAADLSTTEGRQQLLSLCRDADLLLDHGRLPDAGIETATLRQHNPSLSVLSISDWGASGPYAARAASEFTLQAEVGATAYRGYPDRPPFAAGGQIGDYICGTYAAVAAAAFAGRGHDIEVSRFESMLLSFQPYQYIHGQLEPGRVPTSVDVPSVAPARDGWVGFCTITGQQWQSFAEMIGRPELGPDKELATGFQRFQQRHRVVPAIEAWTRERTVETIVAEASRHRIPVAPVGNGQTVLEMAQFKQRDMFGYNPAGFRQPLPPFRLGKGALRPPAAAPHAGGEQNTFRWAATARNTVPTGTRPLQGIRVLDFTAFWAGPAASACYAAFGADVIKVESIQRPDGMRFAAGFFPKDKPLWECSPISHGANTGKRGITLDLESPRGLALAKQLVTECDIVIENFSPRVLEKFGLGWDEIQAINPQALLVRMPAFGLEGPWRDRTGFAMTIEQVSGLAWRTGYPDRSPEVPRGCVDPLGGMSAVFATLCALQLREREGGQLVEVPLVEAGLNIVAEQVIEYSAYGTLLQRHGNRGPEAVPQGVFACQGGEWLALSIGNDEQWRALTQQLPDAPLDRNASTLQRRQSEDALERWLAEQCLQHDVESLVEQLVAAGIPAAPLRNVRELQHHPQLRARGFFTRLRHAVVGELDYPNLPFRIDGHYLPIERPAPLLGEHNEEVLGGLPGMDRAALAALAQDGIIGSTPRFANS